MVIILNVCRQFASITSVNTSLIIQNKRVIINKLESATIQKRLFVRVIYILQQSLYSGPCIDERIVLREMQVMEQSLLFEII